MKAKINYGALIPAGIVGIILVLICVWWFSTSNRLNNEKQDVDSQWSQVQNVMQRRADLIPNLTASVKGSMKQEQKVFGDVAKARSAYNNAGTRNEKLKADRKLNQSVGTLINVINERYPKLESNENVRSLMLSLEGSENRISVERRNYINTVKTYNESVMNFPSSIVANARGMHKINYFQANDDAQSAPKVDLN